MTKYSESRFLQTKPRIYAIPLCWIGWWGPVRAAREQMKELGEEELERRFASIIEHQVYDLRINGEFVSVRLRIRISGRRHFQVPPTLLGLLEKMKRSGWVSSTGFPELTNLDNFSAIEFAKTWTVSFAVDRRSGF